MRLTEIADSWANDRVEIFVCSAFERFANSNGTDTIVRLLERVEGGRCEVLAQFRATFAVVDVLHDLCKTTEAVVVLGECPDVRGGEARWASG